MSIITVSNNTCTITNQFQGIISNKTILSYNKNETALLTANCTDGTGQTISLYNDATNTFIANMTDNGDGTYSYIYNSQGVGDISFRAEYDGSNSIVTIEDCTYYNESDNTDFNGVSVYSDGYMGVTSDSNINALTTPIPMPTGAWKMTFDYKSTRSNSSYQLIHIGESYNENKYYRFNKITRATIQIQRYTTSLKSVSNTPTVNTVYPVEITYDGNGGYTLKNNGYSLTATDTTYSPTYFLGASFGGYSGNGGRIKNIKIKPL